MDLLSVGAGTLSLYPAGAKAEEKPSPLIRDTQGVIPTRGKGFDRGA
jgi:hypothetical protein